MPTNHDTVSDAPSLKGSQFNPLAVAVGLLKNDLSLIPLLIVMLSASSILDALTQTNAESFRFGVLTLDRVLQIAVVTIVVLRWRRLLQAAQGPKVRALPVMLRIGAISVAASIVLTTPFLGIAMSRSAVAALMFVVLLVLGCLWCLRVYLFFAVAGMLGMPMGPGMARAIQMARANTGAILRSLVTPLALSAFFTALFLMPYPDGRSLVWMAAASACEGIFWILSTYTALGLALSSFTESEWRSSGLSHYRNERLSTLEAQGGKALPRYLAPRFGWMMLAVAACFWLGNFARLNQMPPAAKITVSSVAVEDYKVRLVLDIEDREFKYRGFQPQAFALASKTGTPQSNGLVQVSQTPEGQEVQGIVRAKDGEPTKLYLTFSSTKTGPVLRSLDNMWLWYRLLPLVPIGPEALSAAPEIQAKPDTSAS